MFLHQKKWTKHKNDIMCPKCTKTQTRFHNLMRHTLCFPKGLSTVLPPFCLNGEGLCKAMVFYFAYFKKRVGFHVYRLP